MTNDEARMTKEFRNESLGIFSFLRYSDLVIGHSLYASLVFGLSLIYAPLHEEF